MKDLDTREWLLTNGSGSFASGTVCDARTRIYHGWLIAALEPPGRRTLLLSHLEASLEVGGQIVSLGTNFWTGKKVDPCGYQFLQSFTTEPVPTWIWAQESDWQLSRQLVMPHVPLDENRAVVSPTCASVPVWNRVLVKYAYTGSADAILRLRPFIGDRSYHDYQKERPDLSFSQLIGFNQLYLQAIQVGTPGTAWLLRWTCGHYQPEGVWYWSYYYPEEAGRGLDCLEDLYSPGYLSVRLQPGDCLTLDALVCLPNQPLPDLSDSTFDQLVLTERQRLQQRLSPISNPDQETPIRALQPLDPLLEQLLKASDRFITYRFPTHEPCILAGYHWFGRRNRDTLLCIPGLCLTTGRLDLARTLLEQLGRLCQQGLIPSTFPDSYQYPDLPSVDCALWWIETLGLYLEASQDWDFLHQQYEVVKQIYKAFTAGTRYNIRVDASDGLVTWDDGSAALTWMDSQVDGRSITPRTGKPIEINALWYSALCWASNWATYLSQQATSPLNPTSLSKQAYRYTQQAEQVKASLQKFWNPQQGYLYDCIEPDDRFNATIRPNAVLALSLHHCAFSDHQARQVLQVARDRLLTPYGLRSLDPADPAYVGQYAGNPRQRDRAAHQGTVWTWLLGPFVRSWQRYWGPQNIPLPFSITPLLQHFQEQVCLGGISELFDGNSPHAPRGAIAHALPLAELIRHWPVLRQTNNSLQD